MELNKEPFALMDQLRSFIDGIHEGDLKTSIVQRIEQMSRELLNGTKSTEALKNLITAIEDEVLNHQDELLPAASKAISSAQSTVNHVQMIQLTENYYQIPVMMGQELNQLNLYVLNNDENGLSDDLEGIRIFMSFKTQTLGTVQALIEIKGNQLGMNLQSSSPEDQEILKYFESDIRQLVEATNFNMGGIDYIPFKVKDPLTTESADIESKSIEVHKGSTFEVQI
jgi:hypothetical protein